ncbi:hypothetical protein G3I32_05835 [Streptomyces coelicoflavus]|uniref:Uncharacterized protein n=1 Tax=Streptomyces coelicoflavus TaxID=285562 RepID=A0A7K3PHN4_9ACTN|nr:hypothetical protein [Streptomyces coelicoflavus]NEB08395.1 hypothetical protein [Streptomyces coelicoflavus]
MGRTFRRRARRAVMAVMVMAVAVMAVAMAAAVAVAVAAWNGLCGRGVVSVWGAGRCRARRLRDTVTSSAPSSVLY